MALILMVLSVLAYGAFGDNVTLPSVAGNDTGPDAFTKIADGVYDEWQKADAKNVEIDSFALRVVNGSVYLVSRRKLADEPYEAVNRGGIVSKLDLASKTWTHHQFKEFGDEHVNVGEKIFVLNGRLLLATFNVSTSFLRDLFVWSDADGAWKTITYGTSQPETSQGRPDSYTSIDVGVPSPSSTTFYLVHSFFNHPGTKPGSEQLVNKVEIKFDGADPKEGQLKFVARNHAENENLRVVEIAFNGEELVAFVDEPSIDGAASRTDFALVVDGGALKNITLGGTPPTAGFESKRVHQVGKQVYQVGGSVFAGLGQLKPVGDVYALDLSKNEWRKTDLKLSPAHFNDASNVDEHNVYVANLKNGIFSAPLPQ